MTIPPPNYPPPGSPPPPGPPSGPPVGPWGGPPPPSPPPRRPGRLVGGALAVAFVLLLFLIATATTGGFDLLIGGALTGVVGGTVAVAFDRTRPYATGFLLGLAVIVVVGAGACVGILAIFATTY